jgi:peptidoglycan hydrolase CwlO-like protein
MKKLWMSMLVSALFFIPGYAQETADLLDQTIEQLEEQLEEAQDEKVDVERKAKRNIEDYEDQISRAQNKIKGLKESKKNCRLR